MDKINFILPGFLNISRNEILINIYEKFPYITRENSCIHSFYGNFPSCIWNGGRLCLGEKYTSKQMKKVRDFHNNHGIAIALTMTNLVLEKKHLDDKYANNIMRVFNDGKNEVLVSSRILEEYIRNNYKNFKYNRSITSTEKNGYYPENYNLTVLAVRYTNDFNYIDNIPLEYRSKLEILCNEPCENDCKYKYIHYREINHIQIGNDPKIENRNENYGCCRYPQEYFYYRNNNRKFYISPQNIVKNYINRGIKYFKINGREKNQYHGFENIVNYTIKEQYQNDVLAFMIERFILEYENEIKNNIKKFGIHAEENENVKQKIIYG